MKTAVTIGKFDGFHRGHRRLLEALQAYKALHADTEGVVIRLETHKEGILSAEEQEELTSAYGVDRLIRLPFQPSLAVLTPEEFVKHYLVEELSASYVAVGSDFRFGRDRKGDTAVLDSLGKKYGFETQIVEKETEEGREISSSWIRGLLAEGDVEKAEKLLGQPYRIAGIIEHGAHLGTSLGFPTLNILPPAGKLLPRFGAYRSRIFLQENWYQGLTNVGRKPTVYEGLSPLSETYVFGLDRDCYGERAVIELGGFIRPEKRFSSVEELRMQLERDREEALKS